MVCFCADCVCYVTLVCCCACSTMCNTLGCIFPLRWLLVPCVLLFQLCVCASLCLCVLAVFVVGYEPCVCCCVSCGVFLCRLCVLCDTCVLLCVLYHVKQPLVVFYPLRWAAVWPLCAAVSAVCVCRSCVACVCFAVFVVGYEPCVCCCVSCGVFLCRLCVLCDTCVLLCVLYHV